MTKICKKCGLEKPVYYFDTRGDGQGQGINKWRRHCKACLSAQKKEWRKANKHRYKAYDRKHNLKRNHCSLEQYEKMAKEQGNKCAICGKEPESGKGGQNGYLDVDHCHKTNVLRGLLCLFCNTGLGYFKDNVQSLNAAARYLRAFESKQQATQPSPKSGPPECPFPSDHR